MSALPAEEYGNLSFDDLTLKEAAERAVYKLQARLRVMGVQPSDQVYKKVLALRDSMRKNKLKKYDFQLVKTSTLHPAAPIVIEDDKSDLVAEVIALKSGLPFKSKEVKVLPSGFIHVKVIHFGPSDYFRVDPGPNASVTRHGFQRELDEVMYRKHKGTVERFSTHTVRVKCKGDKAAMSVSAYYRVSGTSG